MTPDQIREHIAQFLEMPESFPLVLPAKSEAINKFLEHRNERHERRKYSEQPRAITHFGELT